MRMTKFVEHGASIVVTQQGVKVELEAASFGQIVIVGDNRNAFNGVAQWELLST